MEPINQRGTVTVRIRSRKAVWIEDLIALVESFGQFRAVPAFEAGGRKGGDGAGL